MNMTTTFSDLMGDDYAQFWAKFKQRFPLAFVNVWYEVFVDFWEDLFNEDLPLEENLQNAYAYLQEHQNDYD